MIDLNSLNVVNVEANIEHGFFFVEFENGKSLQCCLSSIDGKYTNQIEVSNIGYDEGLCADCNVWAVNFDEDYSDWSDIKLFLLLKAVDAGVQIIG